MSAALILLRRLWPIIQRHWLPVVMIVSVATLWWWHGNARYNAGVRDANAAHAAAAEAQAIKDRQRIDSARQAADEAERKRRNAREEVRRDPDRTAILDADSVREINDANAKIAAATTR